MLAGLEAIGTASFNLNSFISSSESIATHDLNSPPPTETGVTKTITVIEDVVETSASELTDTEDDAEDVYLSSVESTASQHNSSSLRDQEIASEAPTSLLFGRSTSSSQSPISSASCAVSDSEEKSSIVQGTHKKERASVPRTCESPYRRASTTALPQYEKFTWLNGSKPQSFFRSATDLTTQMRRESIAEKIEVFKAISRSNSLCSIGGVQRRKIQSPTLLNRRSCELSPMNFVLSNEEKSCWSTDETDNTTDDEMDSKPKLDDSNEAAVITTARRVSRSAESLYSCGTPTCLKFSTSTFPDSPTSVTFAQSPRLVHRRGSRVSLSGTITGANSSTRPGDLVKIVTTMQAAHLEETTRLNALTTALSSKEAVLELQVRQQSLGSVEYLASPVRKTSGEIQVIYSAVPGSSGTSPISQAAEGSILRSLSVSAANCF